HSHDATHGAPDGKAEVSDIEVALFEVLPRIIRSIIRMTREVHLAIFPYYLSLMVHENRRIVTAYITLLARQLAITKIEADAELLRAIKKRLSGCVRHG